MDYLLMVKLPPSVQFSIVHTLEYLILWDSHAQLPYRISKDLDYRVFSRILLVVLINLWERDYIAIQTTQPILEHVSEVLIGYRSNKQGASPLLGEEVLQLRVSGERDVQFFST